MVEVDQAKRVEIGDEYLARANPHSEVPALEHAYAVTTYSAQGTPIDRAFVAADPSVDKQELYVAASRSREEIAPESPHLREGIPRIGEAAERDRAQLAAHDEAWRAQFSGLPTEELVPAAPSCGLSQTGRPSWQNGGEAGPRDPISGFSGVEVVAGTHGGIELVPPGCLGPREAAAAIRPLELWKGGVRRKCRMPPRDCATSDRVRPL